MNQRRIYFRIFILLFLVLFLFSAFVIYKVITIKPPDNEVNLARESITLAKNVHAAKYANTKLEKAEKLFNEALMEWNIQNDKFFIFRDYSKTCELAASSLKYSVEAHSDAGNAKVNSMTQLKNKLKEIEFKIQYFEKYYKNLPLGKDILNDYNKGKLNYFEAENNYKKDEFQKGLVMATLAGENLIKAENNASIKVNKYFERFPDWNKNSKLAYQSSKNGKVVFLVNKMESTISIIKSGKVIRVFEAEFGPNWLGEKRIQGDRSTPEGIYKVIEKKKGVKTMYHKALLLNYPNDEDKTQFERLKKSGAISKKAQIGGLIEIHGNGGKGIHWTDGCIALENKDMNVVFDLCTLSTPVFIVGSAISLDEYLISKQ